MERYYIILMPLSTSYNRFKDAVSTLSTMPAKKRKKRTKPDGKLHGQCDNKAKLKRLAKTAVMRGCKEED